MNWRPAYVALGSNLEQPARQVETAFGQLATIPDTRLVLHSRLWKARPMGPQDQPDFINAVAGLLTQLDPRALLGSLAAIEQRMGRVAPSVRWGPRVIDLDLLQVGDESRQEPGLTLPHPGLHQRNFVLYPLAEIAADLWVPGHGRVAALRSKVPGEGLEAFSAGIR
ncbi:MAG TPA: 2-amino-4-hydroxy-6-hydroxymethyldihydropteridine diphosphokinase [Steroidobacteraceae bacterium]|nr:2-amino-4-hydroxy-6-hydroxymethyldihydropteridine diphosphokinase [Steroidobacteraceae bacterium]